MGPPGSSEIGGAVGDYNNAIACCWQARQHEDEQGRLPVRDADAVRDSLDLHLEGSRTSVGFRIRNRGGSSQPFGS